MKNIKLTLLGTAALLIAVGLNIRHALNDYGVRDNKLHVEVLAQSNGSGGGGSTDGGGDSTDGGSSGGTSDGSGSSTWGCGGVSTHIPNETLKSVICWLTPWRTHLKCKKQTGVCCDPAKQTDCDGNLITINIG